TTKRLLIRRASAIRRRRCSTRTPASKGTSRRSGKPASRKKKPRGGELTAAEKRTNRKVARGRVKVEHAMAGVKRCGIVKDVCRNTSEGDSDAAMEAACGLHNLRVQNRKRRLKR